MTAGSPGILTRLLAGMVLLFLALPVLIIFPLAFSNTGYLTFPPSGFSLRWMEEILTDPDWLASMWLSLRVAIAATVLAVALSLSTAIALVRMRFGGKQLVYALILMPMIVPNIITALSMFFFFSASAVFSNVVAIIIGHAVIALPIATIILSATLQGMDRRLDWAAMSMGAGAVTILRRITLPLAAPGILSAAIFAFLSSFDELMIALFMAGNEAQTLPVRIWNSVQFQLSPAIAAVSVLLILISVAALVIANLFSKSR